MTGTSRVCITATTMPANASTGTVAPLALRAGRSVVVSVIEGGLQAVVETWVGESGVADRPGASLIIATGAG
ncbi:hypothetical protein GCM10023336_10080 [Streptomyces similanensis]|uniref:Uncharacterized protein n=1 Tax=Streptomyces similanensis TaxID=1274988 RepID=A0ABP9JW04_9ACTN